MNQKKKCVKDANVENSHGVIRVKCIYYSVYTRTRGVPPLPPRVATETAAAAAATASAAPSAAAFPKKVKN